MVYYNSIFDSSHWIPQINGEANLAFETLLSKVVHFYEKRNRLSGFYNDLKRSGVPEEISPMVVELAKKLHQTLSKMPIYYIGRSLSEEYYSIFRPELPRITKNILRVESDYLVSNFGTFSIKSDFYEVFGI